MRRAALGLAVLSALGLMAFFFALGPLVDRRSNRVAPIALPPVSEAAETLHQSLAVADLHADALLWPRSLLERAAHGHVDLPRLLEGRVALQVFSAVTQTPRGLNYERNDSTTDMIRFLAMGSRWPLGTWGSRLARARFLAGRLETAAAESGGRLVVVRSAADLTRFLAERARNPDGVAALLSIEGAHAADGSLAGLDSLYGVGFRMIGLTHFFDNQVGGSSAGVGKGGLTDFGIRSLAWMEAHRVIVDLAHASPALIDDVLRRSHRPVVVSHTGVQGTCPGPRNLSDAAVRGITERGGLIGIGFWEAAVCSLAPDSIASAIRYAARVGGIAHVALGSDFDGSTTIAFDASELVRVTDALLRAGFTAEDVRKVMGGNVLRFLMENLPPG